MTSYASTKVPQQRAMHVRPCKLVMPQLYQHEIVYSAHDESGLQGVGKVLARIQERHTWVGIKSNVMSKITSNTVRVASKKSILPGIPALLYKS